MNNNNSPVAANEAFLSFIESHSEAKPSVDAHFSPFEEQDDEFGGADDDVDAIDLDSEARCSL